MLKDMSNCLDQQFIVSGEMGEKLVRIFKKHFFSRNDDMNAEASDFKVKDGCVCISAIKICKVSWSFVPMHFYPVLILCWDVNAAFL